MKNEDKEVSVLSALLDFYSDRAVAHASFFVACIFGLFTVLSIAISHQIRILLVIYVALWIFGAYCLMSFGYFAVSAEEIKNQILKYAPTDIEKNILLKIVEKQKRPVRWFFEFKEGGRLPECSLRLWLKKH